ncbi:MAG: 5-formyltetrahydrofolate cyclo-ligase [Alistipes sp.]|nr:5-formyltetrahydrofolate cyclo-ligase [Alistipes sp.]
MMTKKEIRQHIRSLTAAKNADCKARQAEVVTQRLCEIITERKPKIVAAFMPMSDEIAIDIKRLSTLCRVVIPRITSHSDGQAEMEFFDYNTAEIGSGAYGINEPQGEDIVQPEQIDIMILPGMAFTTRGERLGRGKGFYDRYTSREGFRAYCIGVCFAHQILTTLPTEPHDRLIDEVIFGEA